MTATVSLVSFLALAGFYRFTAWDGYLFGLSLYVLAFLASLLSASTFAALSRDRRSILGIGVLWLNFIGSQIAWEVGDPNLYAAGILDILTASYFVLYGVTRWEWTIGGIYLVCVLLSFLSFVGIIPGSEERVASGFIVFSIADLLAIGGHIANAVLGLGAGDSGRRIRITLRVRPWWVPERGLAMRTGEAAAARSEQK